MVRCRGVRAAAGFLDRRALPKGLLLAGAVDGTSADWVRAEDVLMTAIGGRRVGTTVAGYCDAVRDIDSVISTAATLGV